MDKFRDEWGGWIFFTIVWSPLVFGIIYETIKAIKEKRKNAKS